MKRRDLLSGIVAFLSFGLVEKASKASPTKEKAPKWLEEIEKESRESYVKRLEKIAKAHEILRKYSDFTTSELAYVHKAICKSKTGYEKQCEEYRNRFIYSHPKWTSPESTRRVLLGTGVLPLWRIPIWDAICVTFRTGGREDGFNLIDCEFPKDLEEIEKYKDIAQFKRISLPLVNKVYPTLL